MQYQHCLMLGYIILLYYVILHFHFLLVCILYVSHHGNSSPWKARTLLFSITVVLVPLFWYLEHCQAHGYF